MHIYSSADMHIPTILFENMKKVKKILGKMMDELRKKTKLTKKAEKAHKIREKRLTQRIGFVEKAM